MYHNDDFYSANQNLNPKSTLNQQGKNPYWRERDDESRYFMFIDYHRHGHDE